MCEITVDFYTPVYFNDYCRFWKPLLTTLKNPVLVLMAWLFHCHHNGFMYQGIQIFYLFSLSAYPSHFHFFSFIWALWFSAFKFYNSTSKNLPWYHDPLISYSPYHLLIFPLSLSNRSSAKCPAQLLTIFFNIILILVT